MVTATFRRRKLMEDIEREIYGGAQSEKKTDVAVSTESTGELRFARELPALVFGPLLSSHWFFALGPASILLPLPLYIFY